MATNVITAFNEFLSDTVNLDAGVTDRARGSRDWLVGQLNTLHEKHSDFPLPYAERDIFYGSFHRRTKIRELDDIDLISCMHAQRSTYLDTGGVAQIFVHEDSRFASMRFDGTNELNSRLVINRFVQRLSDIPQYAEARIGRNGEAAVLDLASYSWSFDIVPGFFTAPELDGRDYYLIPDGNGRWKKTDPRIDQDRVTRINQKHSGKVLNVIRMIKFWNRRSTMPSIPPYALENLVLTYYDSAPTCSSYVDLEFGPLVRWLASAVLQPIWDPKGLQGDLNTLSRDERIAVFTRAQADARVADEARQAETAGDHKKSIGLWGDILGPSFPTYG